MADDNKSVNEFSATIGELTSSISNLKELVNSERQENKEKLSVILSKIDQTADVLNTIKQELIRIDSYTSKIDKLEKEVEELKIQKNKTEGALSLLRILLGINFSAVGGFLVYFMK